MTNSDEITKYPPEQKEKPERTLFLIASALGLGVGLIYLAFLKPGIWGIDGTEMFWVSYSLVTKGDFTVPAGAGVLGRGGQYYSIRYPLISILATPFVAIGIFLGNLFHLPVRYSAAICALMTPLIITAITTGLVALIAIRLGANKKTAYLAALSYAFGTTALVYAREFFSEPVLTLITTLCIYWAISKDYREHAGASILSGLAILAKPTGIVIGPILSLYFLVKKYPWRTVIGPSLGTVAGVLLFLGYNYLRFESAVKSGQPYERFQIAGVISRFFGLLISPGASGGLFWYCPPTILAFFGFRKLFKSKPIEALLLLAMVAGYLFLQALWQFKGWNWGPRGLVPILPTLLVIAAFIPKRWWDGLFALTFIGFFWNAPTLISYYQRYYAESSDKRRFSQATALWGNPLDAPLFNAWPAAFRQLGDALSHDVNSVINNVGDIPQQGHLASSELLKIVATWWWMLPAAGIPVWVGFAIAVILILAGVWILRWGWLKIDQVPKIAAETPPTTEP